MKGLILKDIYSVRFNIIIGALIMVLPCAVLMPISRVTAEDGTPVVIRVLLYGIFDYVIITIFSSFVTNTINEDFKSGWQKMQLTMPLPLGKIVAAKLSAAAIVVGALTALSLICNITGVIFFATPLEFMLAVPIVLALLQMITLSLSLLCGYYLEPSKTTVIYLFSVIAVAAAAAVFLTALASGELAPVIARLIAYIGVPALAVSVVLFCYCKGKKAVVRDL